MKKILEFIVKLVSNVKWKKSRKLLTESENLIIKNKLSLDYFIILTRREYFLSAFFINLGHFLYTGKWGYYTHVLMNLEDEVEEESDFRLIEATTLGTKYSTFSDVFGTVDSVAFLKPKSMTLDEWTLVLDNAKTHLGKPYDNLFNLKTTEEISCVELVRLALMAQPNYYSDFSNFEEMIRDKKNLTPHMFYECPDFEIYLEIRK